MEALDTHDEWLYRYNERLGILCGENKPTHEQEQIARSEANEAVRQLEHENKYNTAMG